MLRVYKISSYKIIEYLNILLFFFNIYLFVCAGVLLQDAGSLVEACGI